MRAFWLRLLILLLASALQFQALGEDRRFHADEAWFMTFARGAAAQGEWLLPGALDKPPLTLYLSALSMAAFGVVADEAGVLQLDPIVGEFAGRLPNALMTILLVALMMRLARTLLRRESAAWLAGLLLALSPFMLAYGARSFTDIGLLFFALSSWLALARRRYVWAGMALGLAFCCKPQALFALPLLALQMARFRARLACWIRFVSAVLLVGFTLLIWDAARPETSIFTLSAFHNTPDNWVAMPAVWFGRLDAWLSLSAWLLGPPAMTIALVSLAALIGFRHRRLAGASWICLLYICGYLAFHSIVAFNLYDRYLLLILPPLILIVASQLSMRLSRRQMIALGICLLLAGTAARQDGAAIGPAPDENRGIDELARHLNAKPVATVIYDPWLGWELSYYLGVWHDKRRVHYPTAADLAAGAAALAESGERYFAAPLHEPHEAWLSALETTGFASDLDYQRDGYIVYRLTPPEQSPKN